MTAQQIGAVLYTMAHAEPYANGAPGPILVEDIVERTGMTLDEVRETLLDLRTLGHAEVWYSAPWYWRLTESGRACAACVHLRDAERSDN